MKTHGTITQLERRAGQPAPLAFWLVTGTEKLLVESEVDAPVKEGERVEVDGALNSNGTLVASSIGVPATIAKAPAEPIEWGRVVLSAFMSALICILGFELIFYELLTRPVTSLQGGFERVWDFFLLLFFFAEAYVPLLFACSLVLSAFLVKYRRLAHGFWSFVVSLPLTFVIYVLSSLR